MVAVDDDGELVGEDVDWAADAEYIYLGDNVFTWEMPDDETLILTEEDGSVTSFALVEGTADDLGAAMAVLAAE